MIQFLKQMFQSFAYFFQMNICKQGVQYLGVFFRTIRAFFTRRLAGVGARVRRITNFSRNASKMANDSLQSAVSIAQKPSKREDYVETKRLFIAKAFLLKLALGLAALGLIIYFLAWPFVLSHFLTAHFYMEDQRLEDWSGKVVVYADEAKTVPLYAGQLEDGVLQGKGLEYDEQGLVSYQGYFVDGLRSGSGSAYENGILIYEGQFSLGVYEGTGKSFQDGVLVYDGQFVSGVYQGLGKLYQDGALYYEGNFQSGYAEGDGTVYYPSGVASYKGQFSGGAREGTGAAYDESGRLIYQGSFSADVYSGQGILYLAEDQKLSAEFLDGEPNGTVQWSKSGRLYYEGDWSGGQPSGYGTVYSRSGRAIYEGQLSGGTVDGAWLITLTTEELREAFGEASTSTYSDAAGGFWEVNAELGLAALCSYQTEAEESSVYRVVLFQPGEDGWVELLPGTERVSLASWPEDSEIWSGRQSYAPPEAAGLPAGDYDSLEILTPDCRVTILYEDTEGAAVLLSWSRLGEYPAEMEQAAESTGGAVATIEAFLDALDQMESAGAAQSGDAALSGGQSFGEALAACSTAAQAVELTQAALDYWEYAHLRAALEEKLLRCGVLLEEQQAALAMGQSGQAAVSALEEQKNQLEGELSSCIAQQEKALLAAEQAADVVLTDYDLSELPVCFDPSEQQVSDLALVAQAYYQAVGGETGANMESKLKTALIDLADAYTAVQTALTNYQGAQEDTQRAAGAYALGSGEKSAWYEALSAQADARSAMTSALAGFARQANLLNQMTGGWVSSANDWYAQEFNALFQADIKA